MPLGRLLCFALESLAGHLSFLPFVISMVGPLALLLAMLLVYVFVRRELGHPFYGLLALVLFGVTSVYHQAVWWFAASFAVLALDTMLLGLLAAQRWRQTGRGIYLDLTVLACLLAPGWFAIGILAGPLCCLYLMQNAECRMQNERQASVSHSAFCILHSAFEVEFPAAAGDGPVPGREPAVHRGNHHAPGPLRREHGRGIVSSAGWLAVHRAFHRGQSLARHPRRHQCGACRCGASPWRWAASSSWELGGGGRRRSPTDAPGSGTDRQQLPTCLQLAPPGTTGK